MSEYLTEEHRRLAGSASRKENWQRWGTYLPERQWGTVREDHSSGGNAWAFGYDEARSTAYKWGEDGLLGWTDRECRLCFSLALWNGNDDHIKERLFGLANGEGNHGEDVKELYYYLDATPTHSYAHALYKYPQAAFPYVELRETNHARGFDAPEFELLDTGLFDRGCYFDVDIEYAKAAPDDTYIRISATNRADRPARLVLVPTLCFRNNWSDPTPEPCSEKKPSMHLGSSSVIEASHPSLGEFRLELLDPAPQTRTVFMENETARSTDPAFPGKDALDRFVRSDQGLPNAPQTGTKSAFVCDGMIDPGVTCILRLRLAPVTQARPAGGFDDLVSLRRSESDAFYECILAHECTEEERRLSRQAYAGLLWSKQFYFYVGNRLGAEEKRNLRWSTLFCRDVLSMPDKWEYPWFAAWDSAFQLVAMSRVDPAFAKWQLLLFLREWYMHPDGQLPAYEYRFDDVNPPVHAWAVLRVFEQERVAGRSDFDFLERAFQKLLINFTWWVNRLDPDGYNVFGGGFLGLDNIAIFDRSSIPEGVRLGQADGTAWMAFYCSTMLLIALELASRMPSYEDIASKFFQHYVAIIDAFNNLGGTGLWDEEEGFFCDKLLIKDKPPTTLRLRSIVGLIPLSALCVVPKGKVEKLADFMQRVNWFRNARPDLANHISESSNPKSGDFYYLALVPPDRLKRIASRLFDEEEFFSPHGIRGLSKSYAATPYEIELAGKNFIVKYAAAEGDSALFGGNSNWRGPVWFPINLLLLEAIERYAHLLGPNFKMEFPTRSGKYEDLFAVTCDLASRLSSIFIPDQQGDRPCHGGHPLYRADGPWCDLILFSEYFSGDNGRGVGASHQTGWTAVAPLFLEILYRNRSRNW